LRGRISLDLGKGTFLLVQEVAPGLAEQCLNLGVLRAEEILLGKDKQRAQTCAKQSILGKQHPSLPPIQHPEASIRERRPYEVAEEEDEHREIPAC
jgi:hypothetical protein